MIGLFAAVECGDTKKVEQLLVQFPQDTSKMVDYRKRTALHFAVELGNEEVVEVLLDHEGDNDLLGAKDGLGFTALHLACELGHDTIVARLLRENPKLADDRAEESGLSCLHLAVIRGKVSVVKLLLAMAPDLVIMGDELKRLPLYFAVEYGHEEIVEMLMVMECAKSNIGYDEATFHAAIGSGYDKIVSQLLDHCPQLIDVVHSQDETKRSPLHLAADCGHHAIVEQLFARRQPRLGEVGGDYEGNLLHFAAEYGYDTIVAELLVEQPHLIDVVSSYLNMTALHLAALSGHEEIVQQLLAHKPDLVDVNDSDGQNALHLATLRGRQNIVEQLLVHKPDLIDVKDSNGHNALHLATLRERQNIVEQLLVHKPDLIDVKDQLGSTALSMACHQAEPELVACLLARNAAVDAEVVWDALECYRAPHEVTAVLKLLLSHKPELVGSLDFQQNTLLHRVFGFKLDSKFYGWNHKEEEKEGGQVFFNDQLMLTVWQLSPPAVLHARNRCNANPFHVAVASNNKFAIELVQWKFPLDELIDAFTAKEKLCFLPPLLDQLREALLESLNRDVVGTVWEYLGFERKNRGRERG